MQLCIIYLKNNYKIVYQQIHQVIQVINIIVWQKIKIDLIQMIGKLIYVNYVNVKHIILYFNVQNYIIFQ